MAVASRQRRGAALLTILYFVVVVGLLAAAVVTVTRQAAPVAVRIEADAQLVAAAERAVYDQLGNWDDAAAARQTIGTTRSRAVAATAPLGEVTVSVTRLSLRVFSIVGVASAAADGAVRRVNLLVRVPHPAAAPGPLVSAGNVVLGGNVRIVPDTTVCSGGRPAAVVAAPTAQVALDSAASASIAVLHDAVAADSLTYARVAGVTWSDLIARADIHLAPQSHVTSMPAVANGACLSSDTNWGEPMRAGPVPSCELRAPIVYAAGDLYVETGRGQGLLLVEGRIRIAGPFLFSGQIVARRGIESLSDGIDITGIVLSADDGVAGDSSHGGDVPVSLRHGTILRHSVCDAQHGVAALLRPRIVRERAWAEVF